MAGPNRLNERMPVYLMPGEEMHETPDGDMTQDRSARSRQRGRQSSAPRHLDRPRAGCTPP